ncbi:MAG: leucine-rich repeat protein, partial [Ruminococcus sp.]|nr:leucine-rich repeat protein [Ruminococcus sp.]
LKSIVIPDSVTIIIDEAFIGCTALESVVFGHGISTIGDIFQGCTSLKSVTIPNNVTHIYETALLYHKSDFFIYGYKGSYAETYAKENDVQFKMIHVKGDIDLDGLATIHDVTLIQRYCADEIETIEAPVNYVDVDGNDSIDINDATAIQRLLVE